MFENFQWSNEPKSWRIENNSLFVETDNKTDYWRKTFYGFIRSNGHYLYQTVKGDFSCEVELVAEFETLYDQLGLMIRKDDSHWIKAGLEYTDDAVHISTVVTNDFSDWSVVKPASYAGMLKIRLTRHGEAIRVQYMDDAGQWFLLRLAYLSLGESCDIGMMTCSPEREGFSARFRGFTIKEPISRDLHA